MFDALINTLSDKIVSIDDILTSLNRVIIFGAGGSGKIAREYLREKEIDVLYFCDNDPRKQGTSIEGVEVLKPADLINYSDVPVIIASDWGKEIALQLRNLGIERYWNFHTDDYDRFKGHFCREPIMSHLTELEDAYNLLEDELSREAFISVVKFRLTSDPAVLQVSPYERYLYQRVKPAAGDVIIDGGAWIGDTAIRFAKYLDLKCKIFAFEPASDNYNLLLQNIAKENLHDVIVPVKAGLWSETCNLKLKTSIEDNRGCLISDDGEEKIDAVGLDSFAKKERVSINDIKMNIEGAEVQALWGAKETLLKSHPKLQICLYHNVDDLWRIPLLINSINPKYRLYLAHHKGGLFDTVLYAIHE